MYVITRKQWNEIKQNIAEKIDSIKTSTLVR